MYVCIYIYIYIYILGTALAAVLYELYRLDLWDDRLVGNCMYIQGTHKPNPVCSSCAFLCVDYVRMMCADYVRTFCSDYVQDYVRDFCVCMCGGLA